MLVEVEDFFGSRPPLAFLGSGEWLLARAGESPPLTGGRLGYGRHVAGVVLAGVLHIAK